MSFLVFCCYCVVIIGNKLFEGVEEIVLGVMRGMGGKDADVGDGIILC